MHTLHMCASTWAMHMLDRFAMLWLFCRGLSLVPDLGFVSASHDGTLQLWTATGKPVATLAGHTALVYSAAATAGGLIASASEDNTARVWRADGTCLQVSVPIILNLDGVSDGAIELFHVAWRLSSA